MSDYLATLAVIDFGLQWTASIVSSIFKTDHLFDISGGVGFVLLTSLSLYWSGARHIRQFVQTGATVTWSTRLGLFLLVRIIRDGRDRRFDDIKRSPLKLFAMFTIQGVWTYIYLVPLFLLNAEHGDSPLQIRDYVGWGMWAVGFLFEVIADAQKYRFRSDPANKDKYITTGLWSVCRHPNYFGEILMCVGLHMSASVMFQGRQHLTALSPLFLILMITCGSGVPLMERQGRERWSKDPRYAKYVTDTPVLIPFIY